MASFPPNVEDREHWLPPATLQEEIYRRRSRPVAEFRGDFACELPTSSMEALAHRLAYAILDETHHRSPEPPPVVAPLSQSRLLKSSRGFRRFEQQSAFQISGSRPKPVQPPLSKQAAGATRVPRKPGHNQVLFLSGTQSERRGLPFRVAGSGASGFIRESGGTGVFLPRVLHTEACMRRKPNKTNSLQEEIPPTNPGFGRGALEKSVDLKSSSIQSSRGYHQPSEISLPSEWTY